MNFNKIKLRRMINQTRKFQFTIVEKMEGFCKHGGGMSVHAAAKLVVLSSEVGLITTSLNTVKRIYAMWLDYGMQ